MTRKRSTEEAASSFDPPGTVAALLQAAARHGVALIPSTTGSEDAPLDESGLDFRVAHAQDAAGLPWVVRTPRRLDVVEAARTEAKVLAFVKGVLPVPVPDWRVHDDIVIAYPRLPGRPISEVKDGAVVWVVGPSPLPEPLVDDLAALYGALHSADVAAARAAGVPVKSLEDDRRELRDSLRDTRTELAPSERLWTRWQRHVDDDAAWAGGATLIHGDLHTGHLLVDDNHRLVGVLDWTEGKVSNPLIDLAMVHGCFGAEPLAQLVAALKRRGSDVPAQTAAWAAERWSTFPALGATWALRTGNDAVLAYARSMVEAANAAEEG